MRKIGLILILGLSFIGLEACTKKTEEISTKILQYSFDDVEGSKTHNEADGKEYKIEYVFNESNQENLFKKSNDPLLRKGVKDKALYMDGFSNYISNSDFMMSDKAFTISAWIAPRVFENLANYGGDMANQHPRLTSILNQGDIELGEGFCFGYGRLGLWGIQLALHNKELDEDIVVGYYDPLHALPLYEWSFLSVSFDGDTGYIALAFNGEISYEALIPDLKNTELISSSEPLLMGAYTNPMIEFGINRQMPSGLIDEVEIYSESFSPKAQKEHYLSYTENQTHPTLDFKEIQLDSSVYEGDRYRPQYHAIPPAVWMNEPHAPFYYKGRYHVFYQHNPAGPYWSQIRWGHIVSSDMIHWEYVKDAVVPTKGIAPEGVWTGGACIGPDGTPWLAVTAGTNTSSWSGQNVAFAHATDPNDPNLTDWVLEDTVVITQPGDDSQGERDQFRDPFVWFDDGYYYMLVSTSIPGRGGSGNIYRSLNMREWEYKGYLFEIDYGLYPEQGIHWECVVLLPIHTKDGSKTKYILFDTPQYPTSDSIVECYYWIGEFDKQTCRFIADDDKPRLFDYGRGIYTGQNGFCYLTDEEAASGKTYEQGRSILYAIAQGKEAGTTHNAYAGWAHNFAIPLELYLSDDGKDVVREPIREIECLYDEELYSYEGDGKSVSDMNEEIKNIRGDTLEIKFKIELDPHAEDYSCGINLRFNPNVSNSKAEKTELLFTNKGVYVNRAKSSYVALNPTNTWENTARTYEVTILLDRSMVEIYINGIVSFTTRVYPKYGDSDYLSFFDQDANLKIKALTVRKMKSAYQEVMTPPYYENTGNLESEE